MNNKMSTKKTIIYIIFTTILYLLSLGMGIWFQEVEVYFLFLLLPIVFTLIFKNHRLFNWQIVGFILILSVTTILGFPGIDIQFGRKTFVIFCFVYIFICFFLKYFMKIVQLKEQEYIEKEQSIDDMSKVVYAKCLEAKTANRAKSLFISQMSHEIRTPINAIMGMNEMIIRESKDENIINYASTVTSSSKALLSIVNDVLDISKIEAGKMEVVEEQYDVAVLLTDAFDMINNRVKSKNLSFIVKCDEDVPRYLWGDSLRIGQILMNLLTNTVKYTHKGGITMAVFAPRSGDGVFLTIEITDTGIGIKPEDMDKLFDKFERLELKRNQNIEGSGLGLFVTKNLVELMGGTIKVNSVYGKGSTFTVMIPQKMTSFEPIGVFEPESHRNSINDQNAHAEFIAEDVKILAVDDVEMNLVVLKNLLKKYQIQLDSVMSGAACLEKIKQEKYDLIFLDHMMPELDGIETFKLMQKDKQNLNYDVPVIMLTANAIVGMEKKYLEDGFSGYLSKPVLVHELEEILTTFLPKVKLKIEEKEQKDIMEQHVSGLEYLKLNIPDIDIDSAMNHCAGNEAFYIEMLNEFVENKLIDKIPEMFECKNWPEYTIQVHSLKGLARMLGLTTLGELAEMQQFAAQSGQEELIVDKHDLLMKTYKQMIEVIKKAKL